jgi:hypothetical protein
MQSHRSLALTIASVVVLAPALHAASPEFHAEVAAGRPLVWYRLNETTGFTILNHGSLGAFYNASTIHNPILGAPTPSGDAGVAFLQADQEWIESHFPAPSSLTINPTFTIEAVVRIDPSTEQPNYAPFLHWGHPVPGHAVFFGMWHNSPDRIFVGFHNAGLRTVDSYNLGCFHHLVWTRDSAGGAAGPYEGSTLYLNGIPVELEIDDVLPGIFAVDVHATTFRIQKATDAIRHFTGTVDELAVYDHVLTHGEVVSHFVALQFDPIPICPVDLNFSGSVNGLDLAMLLAAWSNPAGVVNPCSPTEGADFNCDCKVNGLDLATLLAAWGNCPPRT